VLRQARHQQIIAIVAPAGYGKTTLLEQWGASGPRTVAWVTVANEHNDPVALFTELAVALERQGVLVSTVFEAMGSPGSDGYVLARRLLAAVRDGTQPVRLVVDDLHLLKSHASLDAFGELIAEMPPGWQLAIAGRDALALPLARWRASGALLEVGPEVLALDVREVASLARRLRMELSTEDVHELVHTSAGWPAIVYLALLAARRDRSALGKPVSGTHPTIADYLRSELLERRRSESEIAFLTRTSILDSLTGPLCDAVVEGQRSARLLEALARSTLLVDDKDGSYRYHSLLREFLRDELGRREPDVAELHRRAAIWYERNGQIEAAVDHAFAAGDLDLAAASVGRAFAAYRWSGRRATTRAWLRRFSEDALQQRPWLAVLGAVEESGIGDLPAAERLADIVERATFQGRPHDGTASFESGRAILRALMCRTGIADVLTNASRAVELEPPGSLWRGVARWALANALLLSGDAGGADTVLADTVAAVDAATNAGIRQVALGQRALLAIDRGDWSAAASLSDEAGDVVAAAHLDGYQITAISRAAQARVAVSRGDIHVASARLSSAVQLRPQLTATLPWLNVQALLALARAHLAVDDRAGAQTLLAQARDVVRLRPNMGSLSHQVVALTAEISARPAGLAGATSLTAAELRVLQYLPLYLSFKEIGDRLGVKSSTVQTHAVAIYGKLGASSRSEAVDLAIAARLLEAPPHWMAPSHHAWDAERHRE
jgi:LuxR family transcriptional regulator, maltose regulon positive regulatory protein